MKKKKVKREKESKITLTKRNSLEELNELFTKGTLLPGTEITYLEDGKSKIYHKPFGNVGHCFFFIILLDFIPNSRVRLKQKCHYLPFLISSLVVIVVSVNCIDNETDTGATSVSSFSS